jgi:hypothetical protein
VGSNNIDVFNNAMVLATERIKTEERIEDREITGEDIIEGLSKISNRVDSKQEKEIVEAAIKVIKKQPFKRINVI